MKKLLLGTALSTALLLAACGSEEPEAETMKAEETEVENEQSEAPAETEKAEEAAEETETIEDNPDSEEIKELENGTYEIQMAKVEITGTEILPPNEYSDSGKDQLAIHYDVTSKVNPDEVDTEVSTMNVWLATANPTQETDTSIVDLGIGMSPLDGTYDEMMNSQMDVIKKDATVSGVTFYELENRENPVIIEFTQGFMGDSLGTMEIDVSE